MLSQGVSESSCYLQYKWGSDDSVKAFDGLLMSDNVMLLKVTVRPRCFALWKPWMELRSGVHWGKPDLRIHFVFQLWRGKKVFIVWKWSALTKSCSLDSCTFFFLLFLNTALHPVPSGWRRRTTLVPVSTFTLPSTTGDSVIQYTCMNKWRYEQLHQHHVLALSFHTSQLHLMIPIKYDWTWFYFCFPACS